MSVSAVSKRYQRAEIKSTKSIVIIPVIINRIRGTVYMHDKKQYNHGN